MADSTEKSVKKNIRVSPEQWQRIESAAAGTALTANQLLMELAIEALNRRERPQTVAEIRVARASLFTAQAIARDLIAAGREKEVEEIRGFISTIVPDVTPHAPDPDQAGGPSGSRGDETSQR